MKRMTIERAIEILDTTHRERYSDLPDGMEQVNKACRMGMRALKKKLPQKVIFENIGYDTWRNENVYACICPSCGLYIFGFSNSDVTSSDSDEPEKMFHDCLTHHDYRGLNNFCNRCGQALNWKGK